MLKGKKQIQWNIAAFLLLFLVSFYRQVSLRFLPDDPFRTYLLYACYVFLIGAWVVSICIRVTQKSMSFFLVLEAMVMLTGLTIRFLQDTFWFENIRLMKESGLYIEATILWGLVFGIFASLGIGQWDDYKIPRKWYLLLIPVIAMTYLCITDEERHFMFYVVADEKQLNLSFHPYIGTFLLTAMAMLFMAIRVVLIYWRNRTVVKRRMERCLVSLFEPILAIVSCFGYFLFSLQLIPMLEGVEIIELFAKIYYIEVLTWEFYIYKGLVPVNTHYAEIFQHATIGMQIIEKNGYQLLSQNAMKVSEKQLEMLKDSGHISVKPGTELHMHQFQEGMLLWNKDVSLLDKTIRELNQSAETLAQEGILLNEEMKTKNQESRILAKNQIYDELTKEVKGQLGFMKEILKKHQVIEENNGLIRNLCLLGTYVKRRCNLRLIQKETGRIQEEDLKLSFQDMVAAMRLIGIQANIQWNLTCQFDPEFSIWLFDVLENLLEYERFVVREITIIAKDHWVKYDLKGSSMKSPDVFIQTIDRRDYQISLENGSDGYIFTLTQGGE